MTKIGVLLVNIGTPALPKRKAIGTFLKEFLSDPRVMDIPALYRYCILYLLVLPFRPRRIVPKYRRIWTERGSPLTVNGLDLARKVAQKLGSGYAVETAMRYGEPSIKFGLDRLLSQKVHRLTVVPLMPQYASATTGTIVEKVFDTIRKQSYFPEVVVKNSFYDHSLYIDSVATVGRKYWGEKPDHILFSFHGLPRNQLRKTEMQQGFCFGEQDCCNRIQDDNFACYRAQCFATAREIAAALTIPRETYSVAFQSRFGRAEWIGPHTNDTIQTLARRGVERLVVFCPSFVADCLETLEEIQWEGKRLFERNGGKELILVPSLNTEPVWIDALSAIIAE